MQENVNNTSQNVNVKVRKEGPSQSVDTEIKLSENIG